MTSDARGAPAVPVDALHWRRFLRRFLATAFVAALAASVPIVLVDPYATMPADPSVHYPMLIENQRYAFPALARSGRFDSIIFGNSTMQLLDPRRFDEELGGAFAQLSMSQGLAYEQHKLVSLFLRHHPHPRMIVQGIDYLWCQPGPASMAVGWPPFPEWLYDENPWNDFTNQFNRRALETRWNIALFRQGRFPERFDQRGYRNYVPPRSQYDLRRVRTHIYGQPEPIAIVTPPGERPLSAEQRARLEFGQHAWLREWMRQAPPDTMRVIVMVPYHRFIQSRPGSSQESVFDECKARIAKIAADAGNSRVVDFMIASKLTTNDENYWDPLHYGLETAELLVKLIGEAVRTGVDKPGYYRVLAATGAPPPLPPR